MKFRLITKNLLAKQVAKKWKRTYTHPQTKQWHHIKLLDMYEKIVKLGKRPAPEEIVKIVGNDTWTQLLCNFCGEEKYKVIEIQRNQNSMNICKSCIDEISKEGKRL